jgi:hypothetical protein
MEGSPCDHIGSDCGVTGYLELRHLGQSVKFKGGDAFQTGWRAFGILSEASGK